MAIDIEQLRDRIRPDFVPADAYFRPEFVMREKEMLWPHGWLMACREEQLAQPGEYHVFDVADESVLLVRTAAGVKAFYNVCPHRGRRLKEGCGHLGEQIVCRFHGWRWDIEGRVRRILDRDDWNETGGLPGEEVDLTPVRVGQWSGWIFVTMDDALPPLEDYLDPLPDVFAKFDYRNTRIAWLKTLVVACNWKVVLEAFLESYHVEATHPQTLKFGARTPGSKAFGRHSMFYYPFVAPSAPAEGAPAIDFRKARYAYIEEMNRTLSALQGRHALAAAERLLRELPQEASAEAVGATYLRFHREAMEADGATYPSDIGPADLLRAGTAWNIFPNMIILPTIDGCQVYRARPNGDDPNSAIFDVWWLERSAPDAPSSFTADFYPDMESFKGMNFFLEQDFDNIKAVQQGVKSQGFRGARPNPRQEITVSHFEKTYYAHLATLRGE